MTVYYTEDAGEKSSSLFQGKLIRLISPRPWLSKRGHAETKRRSALCSDGERIPRVFLLHPGGPFWTKKDAGAWSIPKGEYIDGEAALTAAYREFEEETGFAMAGELIPLTDIRQRSGKIVTAWAFKGKLRRVVSTKQFLFNGVAAEIE